MFDPRTELHELDFEALRNIQRLVLEEEARDGREARFRSILVYSAPEHKSIMQLYKAIWDLSDLPGVEFFVVASKAKALQILDSAPRIPEREAG